MEPIKTRPVRWQVSDRQIWIHIDNGKYYVDSFKGELYRHCDGYHRFIDVDEIPDSSWEPAPFDDMQEACRVALREI